MPAFWKIFWIALGTIIIVVPVYFIFAVFYSTEPKPAVAIDAVSDEVLFFIESDHPHDAVQLLTGPNTMLRAFSQNPEIKTYMQWITQYDSIAGSAYPGDILSNSTFILSVNSDTGQTLSTMLIVELPEGDHVDEIKHFFFKAEGDKSILMEKSHGEVTYFPVNLRKLQKLLYFAVHKQLFLASCNEQELKQTIDRLNNGSSLNADNRFRQLAATAGKNVDAHIYLNYANLGKTISVMLNPAVGFLPQQMSELATWTETDLSLNDRELLLIGYTLAGDSASLLSAFRQEPQPITVTGVLPASVDWMVHFGMENPRPVFENLAGANARMGRDLFSWMGSEIAVAGATNNNMRWLVVKAADIIAAGVSLDKMHGKNNPGQTFETEYNGYPIKQINDPDLLSANFGKVFGSISGNYYILLKNYVIFADSPDELKELIDDFYQNRVFSTHPDYRSFADNIADRSNLFLYANPGLSAEFISGFLEEKMKNVYTNNKNLFLNFDGIALQYSYVNDMFYTSLFARYNPEYHEVDPTEWKTKLESKPVGKPFLLPDHRDGKQNIIVFDAQNAMYLINARGKIEWRLPLAEQLLGEVYAVDYYKNGKWQYLFNTAGHLYLVDVTGQPVAGYPLKLPVSATGSVAVFDYNNDNDYRLLIPLNDNKIYNFDLQGEEVEGWHKFKTRSAVKGELQHLVAGNRDYLFTTDENGLVHITDRRGEERIRLKKQFGKAASSMFYENVTNSKGLFITTDRKGQLVYIDENGQTDFTSFGTFSADHWFLYEDFDGNRSKDFLFVDKNRFLVFDRFKEVLLEHTFSENILTKPLWITISKKNYLGFFLPESNEIQLFDAGGRAFSALHFESDLNFTSGNINGGNQTNLITGNGNFIVNYGMEE
ncbi:MAG: DUF3352 domain-containing protein [Bacteroidales bacterium]|nr:DUF3352 domain-containing protein [Bacteroidales bacterium]